MSNFITETFAAKTDLSAKKGYAVYVTTDTAVSNTAVAAICGANAKAVGIIIDPPYGANHEMGVVTSGRCKAIAGASFNAGVPLKTNTDGTLILADTDKDHVIALSRKASGGAGEFVDVEVIKYDLAV